MKRLNETETPFFFLFFFFRFVLLLFFYSFYIRYFQWHLLWIFYFRLE